MARRSTLHRTLRWTAAGLVLLVAAFAAASAYVDLRYASRIVPASEAPAAPVALVFGAGLTRSEPSPLLAERLDTAIALYRQGKVKRILVSGDNSDRYHDETEAMRRYAVDQGIPPADVLQDDWGLSTYDSCVRAREVFHLDQVLLVTQRFHLPRATFIANSVGLDARGVPADPATRQGSLYALRARLPRPLPLGMVLLRPRPAGGDQPTP